MRGRSWADSWGRSSFVSIPSVVSWWGGLLWAWGFWVLRMPEWFQGGWIGGFVFGVVRRWMGRRWVWLRRLRFVGGGPCVARCCGALVDVVAADLGRGSVGAWPRSWLGRRAVANLWVGVAVNGSVKWLIWAVEWRLGFLPVLGVVCVVAWLMGGEGAGGVSGWAVARRGLVNAFVSWLGSGAWWLSLGEWVVVRVQVDCLQGWFEGGCGWSRDGVLLEVPMWLGRVGSCATAWCEHARQPRA